MIKLSQRDQLALRRLKETHWLLRTPIEGTLSLVHQITGITYNKLTIMLDKGIIVKQGRILVWDSVEPSMHMLSALRKEQNNRYFKKEPKEEETKYGTTKETLCSIKSEDDYYIIKVRKDRTSDIPDTILFHQMFGDTGI